MTLVLDVSARLPERPPWFPDLPEDWRRERLDHVASINARIGWKALTADEYLPDGYAFLATPNIKGRTIDFENVNYISEFRYEESPELQLQHGDVLLAKDGNTLGIVNLVTELPRPATVNGSIAVIRPSAIHPPFLAYYFRSIVVQSLIDALKGGMGVPHLFQFDLKRFPVPVPPVDAQRGIARYLDRETARIDALVGAKRRIADLMAERWEALRNHLVTGVLTRSVRLRRGPEWLGSIPVDWSIQRLKFLARMESGHTPDRKIDAYWVDCRIPWITLNDVGRLQHDWTISHSVNAINQLGMANSAAHILPAGTVVLSRDATVGRAAILGKPMAVSQHFVGWICGPRLMPEYLLHVLRGPMQRHFMTLTAGATIATIGMPELNDLVVPVPPVGEQRRIVEELRLAEGRFGQAKYALDRQVALLHERRHAMITAAVMGQVEIAEAA